MSADSRVPEQFLQEEYNTKQHPWFSKLDWSDDRKYYKFGKDKNQSHCVTRKSTAPIPVTSVSASLAAPISSKAVENQNIIPISKKNN